MNVWRVMFLLSGCLAMSCVQADNRQLERLLYDKKQRQLIDKARQRYLEQRAQKSSEKLQVVEDKNGKKHLKKVKWKAKPTPLHLDSILIMPDGRATVVINGRWLQSSTAGLHFEVDPKRPDQVILKIGRKTYALPVGATFDPSQKKVIQPKIMIQSSAP